MCRSGSFGNKLRYWHTGIAGEGNKEFHTFTADVVGQLEGVMKDFYQLGLGGAFQVQGTL